MIRIAAATLAALLVTGIAQAAQTLTVLGTDDIFAAGLATAPLSAGGGGTLPSSIAVVAGQTIHVNATGTISCCSGTMPSGPDGFATNPFGGAGSHITNSTGSAVGNYDDSSAFSLAGVFLGGAASTPFRIGSSGSFVVPVGATRLYFGIPDGYGFNGPSAAYGDNSGSFSVTVGVPEPTSWALLVAGFGVVGMVARRRRTTVAA